jgi:CspA family cold shock protein
MKRRLNTMNGIVKWYNKTKKFGFITGEDNADYFAHYSKIVDSGKYKELEQGQKVVFDVEKSEKGMAAINIVVE